MQSASKVWKGYTLKVPTLGKKIVPFSNPWEM